MQKDGIQKLSERLLQLELKRCDILRRQFAELFEELRQEVGAYVPKLEYELEREPYYRPHINEGEGGYWHTLAIGLKRGFYGSSDKNGVSEEVHRKMRRQEAYKEGLEMGKLMRIPD